MLMPFWTATCQSLNATPEQQQQQLLPQHELPHNR
jgi:hypothetical protein